MELFSINQETCNQDGICAAVCPVGVIDFTKGTFPAPAAEAEATCIRCGHCVAVCPTASLNHRDMAVADCPAINRDLVINEAQCEQFLRARRSIRVYRKQPVPQAELARLIELARYAPTGRNSQSVHWLVLSGREQLHRLSGLIADWMRWMIAHRPEMASSMHMERTVAVWEAGQDVFLRSAPALIVAHGHKDDRMATASGAIALAYLELAAVPLGLGCCWAGYFHAAAVSFPPLIEALALPEGHQCLGAMMVGQPVFRYHRLPTRKEPAVIWRLAD